MPKKVGLMSGNGNRSAVPTLSSYFIPVRFVILKSHTSEYGNETDNRICPEFRPRLATSTLFPPRVC